MTTTHPYKKRFSPEIAIGTSILAAGVITLGFFYLRNRNKQELKSEEPRQVRHFQDFDATATEDGFMRMLTITETNANTKSPKLFVTDFKDGYAADGRIDVIALRYLPRGHYLERYANLEQLTKVYNEFWPTNSLGEQK